jgi:hypothetical protein
MARLGQVASHSIPASLLSLVYTTSAGHFYLYLSIYCYHTLLYICLQLLQPSHNTTFQQRRSTPFQIAETSFQLSTLGERSFDDVTVLGREALFLLLNYTHHR